MAEDWRVKVVLEEEHHGSLFGRWLRDHKLEKELAEALRGRVVVSQEDEKFFLYAESREQAEAATEVVNAFLSEHQLSAEIELTRWHEAAERWEDPSVPLPTTDEEVEAERQRLTETERQESAEGGMDQWQVLVELPDHGSTKKLGDQLEGEGLHVSRRWRYLVVAVPSEADGNALAERIRAEAPSDAKVSVEGVYGDVVAGNPYSGFSLFGGLGN
jgi:hypothetical protein